jgi:hypothetical protein
MTKSEVGLVEGCLEPGLCLNDIVCVQVLDVVRLPGGKSQWWPFQYRFLPQSMSMPFSYSVIAVPAPKSSRARMMTRIWATATLSTRYRRHPDQRRFDTR